MEDRELEIIHELAESVLPFAEAISNACDICAELDCLLCFAEVTSLYNYRRPRMSNENVIKIQQGRHPLQEQTVDTFVPNDVFLVGGAGIDSYPDIHGEEDDLTSEGSTPGNSVLICTGANACGKSVYLKQVRSFVPGNFLGPRLRTWRLKGRTDSINGTNWLVSFIGCRFRMTHFGASFVPAESATLGIVDKSAWCLGPLPRALFFSSYFDV